MASGAHHYGQAEQSLRTAKRFGEGSEAGLFHMQAAMVHATLANAAATAMFAGDDSVPVPEWREWHDVCGKGTQAAGQAGDDERTRPCGC